MEKDPAQSVVNAAFWIALLLGCDTAVAEAAVLEGIGTSDNASRGSLMVEVVEATLRRRAISAVAHDAGQLLPVELRRLFQLQPLLRDCFVLRILAGLSVDVCSKLLNIPFTEFEVAFRAALQHLPFLFSEARTIGLFGGKGK